MLCDKCHQREATVHLRFVDGEKMLKKDLCEVCGPTKDQMKQDPSKALGAEWPKGWPKPPTISDDAA
jgi:protein-arginine kinase activator protein McsA